MIAVLVLAVKLIADDFSVIHREPSEDYDRLKALLVDPTPTPSFDEQVAAFSEKLDALGWKSYGHFGEFHLSTDSPKNVWVCDEEVQGYIDAIKDTIISGS